VPPREFFEQARRLAEILGGRGEGGPRPAMPVIRDVIGASTVEQLFGVNGSGVVIAVVDTGVDYGHPNLQDALAWLIRTKDGREIVASSVSLEGSTLRYRTLRGQAGSLPASSVAAVEPLVLDADESQVVLLEPVKPVSGVLPVRGRLFFVLDGWWFWPVVARCNYTVAGLTSKSGVYRFGMTRMYIPWYGGLVEVGVVMYDPEVPGVYTAARIDVNDNCNFGDDVELQYFGNRLAVDSLDGPDEEPRRCRRVLLRLGVVV
jgi:hypothetical protein